MKRKNYTPKILDDEMIKDGLCAVSTLSDGEFSRENYFVVGGVAVQSYLPSSCRRPTSDIDLAVLKPLCKEDFKKFAESAFQYLSDRGYKVASEKARRAFCLTFEKGDEANFISFAMHNHRSFRDIEDILYREKSHTRHKIVEGRVDSYEVASPEDISIRKIARAINRLERNPLFEEHVNAMRRLDSENIKLAIENMNSMREGLYENYEHSRAEKLRFIADLHDIRLLSELTGFNVPYFIEAIGSWDTLSHESFEKDLILRAVLPSNLRVSEALLNH